MCIITPPVSALFHRTSRGTAVGNAAAPGSSFNIHYNTLFIKQAGRASLLHRIHPVMHYCRRGFYRDCGTLARCFTRNTQPLYHSVPEASSPDPGTACSLHLYPVYVDSCMHYEVVVAACLCEVFRFFFFCIRDHCSSLLAGAGGRKKKKESLFSLFVCLFARLFFPLRKSFSSTVAIRKSCTSRSV